MWSLGKKEGKKKKRWWFSHKFVLCSSVSVCLFSFSNTIHFRCISTVTIARLVFLVLFFNSGFSHQNISISHCQLHLPWFIWAFLAWWHFFWFESLRYGLFWNYLLLHSTFFTSVLIFVGIYWLLMWQYKLIIEVVKPVLVFPHWLRIINEDGVS